MEKNEIYEILIYLRQIIQCEANLMDAKKALSEVRNKISTLGVGKSILEPVYNPGLAKGSYEDMDSVKAVGVAMGVLSAIIGLLINLFGGPGLLVGGGIFAVFSLPFIVDYNNKKSRYEKMIEDKLRLYEQEMESYQLEMKDENSRIENEIAEKAILQETTEKIEQLIGEIENTLSILYSQDELHSKYRNKSAVVAIYDYLSTGRTRSLEIEANDPGAYNIYENDSLIGKSAVLIASTVNSMGNRIVGSINYLQGSMNVFQDYVSNNYQVQLNLAESMREIKDNERANLLLQKAILEQEKLRTDVLREGPSKVLRNKDGYRVG